MEQTQKRVSSKIYQSNTDSKTIKLDIQLVQDETGNTRGRPKSNPTLEQWGFYWLFQGPNTVWLTGTNVKGKLLHDN